MTYVDKTISMCDTNAMVKLTKRRLSTIDISTDSISKRVNNNSSTISSTNSTNSSVDSSSTKSSANASSNSSNRANGNNKNDICKKGLNCSNSNKSNTVDYTNIMEHTLRLKEENDRHIPARQRITYAKAWAQIKELLKETNCRYTFGAIWQILKKIGWKNQFVKDVKLEGDQYNTFHVAYFPPWFTLIPNADVVIGRDLFWHNPDVIMYLNTYGLNFHYDVSTITVLADSQVRAVRLNCHAALTANKDNTGSSSSSSAGGRRTRTSSSNEEITRIKEELRKVYVKQRYCFDVQQHPFIGMYVRLFSTKLFRGKYRIRDAEVVCYLRENSEVEASWIILHSNGESEEIEDVNVLLRGIDDFFVGAIEPAFDYTLTPIIDMTNSAVTSTATTNIKSEGKDGHTGETHEDAYTMLQQERKSSQGTIKHLEQINTSLTNEISKMKADEMVNYKKFYHAVQKECEQKLSQMRMEYMIEYQKLQDDYSGRIN